MMLTHAIHCIFASHTSSRSFPFDETLSLSKREESETRVHVLRTTRGFPEDGSLSPRRGS